MSFIRLDSQAFAHNISLIKKIVPDEKISVVLKDNAYGHGLDAMATLAEQNGIRHAVVRTVGEAEQVQGRFDSVLVLAEIPEKSVDERVQIAVNSLDEIKKTPRGCGVHLKVDTGMHRNGVNPQELRRALEMIKEGGLELKGIFSHVRSGDELSSELFWQYKNFQGVQKESEALCAELGLSRPLFHFANSPTLLRFKDAVVFDRVRVGIAAYGYHEFPGVFKLPSFKPVLSLWGEKIASRRLRQGERVGYGGAGEMNTDGVVSTYDLGYADGLFRHDGAGEFLLEDGTPVIGKISMDNLSLACEDRAVKIIGNARHWAQRFGTITYDVLVKLSSRIKREIV